MARERFVIAGAGGYACELVSLVRLLGHEPVCLLDDGQPDPVRIADTAVELGGTVDDAHRVADRYVVGIGYPQPRLAVAARLDAQGLEPVDALVHPAAVLMGAAPLAAGTVVFPNSTVSRGAVLGRHVLVNYNASVGHDTTVGDGTTISPGAQVGGQCAIGSQVLVGSGAIVLQDRAIGDGAVIGSGAVVTRDVDDGQTVTGVPAHPR